MERIGLAIGSRIRLQGVARQTYLDFALSDQATWPGNFRDLIASLTRLATLAPGGVVTEQGVLREITRLEASWSNGAATESSRGASTLDNLLSGKKREVLERLDSVNRHTLEFVAQICQRSKSAAEAARTLFDKSRLERKSVNDSDRIKKYLQQFGLEPADFL